MRASASSWRDGDADMSGLDTLARDLTEAWALEYMFMLTILSVGLAAVFAMDYSQCEENERVQGVKREWSVFQGCQVKALPVAPKKVEAPVVVVPEPRDVTERGLVEMFSPVQDSLRRE